MEEFINLKKLNDWRSLSVRKSGRHRLEQVVEHYSSGVHPHANLGLAFNDEAPAGKKETSGFRLSAAQKSALVAFLKTLTDEKYISDSRFSDPFVRLKLTEE